VQRALWFGNFKGRHLLGELNVDGRISFKLMIRNRLEWGEEWMLFARDRIDWTLMNTVANLRFRKLRGIC